MGWTEKYARDPGHTAAPDVVMAFDARADALLDPWRGPALDTFFYGISSAADHSLIWHVLGAWRAAARKDPAWAAKFALVMGAESAVTNGLVKRLFRRVRPEHPITEGPLPMGMRRPITSSFPSGHATAAFTAAAVLSDDGNTVAWFALATVVAYSRVYVRMHHTSDIVVGAALGLALGRVARRVLR